MLSRDCIGIIFPLSLLTTQWILRHNAGNNMFSGAKNFPPTCFLHLEYHKRPAVAFLIRK